MNDEEMNPAGFAASSSEAPRNLDLLVGGQAVLEGIMMRGRKGYAVAVRKSDGSVAISHGAIPDWSKKIPMIKWPFFRGAIVLVHSLVLGLKALHFAAEHADMAEEKPKKDAAGDNVATLPRKPETLSQAAIAGTLAIAVVLGLAVFVLMPLGVTVGLQKWVWPGMPNLAFNAIDGLVRVIAFILYLWGISRLPEIGRVFQYHGAEHKVVYAYEDRGPMTVDVAQSKSRLHPRCGTSFLFFVLVVSILCFAMIPKTSPIAVKLLGRIVLMPLVAGIAYETIRWTGKNPKAPLVRPLIAPGLWLQNITTREPSADMVEIALIALTVALRYDGELVDSVEIPGEAGPEQVLAAGAA